MDEYESSTNAINTILTQPVLDWANLPGSLTKVSSSASGFAWGFSGGTLYRCELPCTGNWKQIEIDAQEILDIDTDDINVYVLGLKSGGATYLYTSSSSNPSFVEIQVPFAAKKIFSTHTFIWAQDSSNKKERCAKPCTTGLWTPVEDVSVKITSSSDSALYGRDGSGVGMKSDETLQSGWSPIKGMSGVKLNSLLGGMDSTALYGIDSSSNLLRCEGDCSNPPEQIDTVGYAPLSVSADPYEKDVWMTTATTGTLGNIFNKSSKSSSNFFFNSRF